MLRSLPEPLALDVLENSPEQMGFFSVGWFGFLIFFNSNLGSLGEERCALHKLLYMEKERGTSVSSLSTRAPGQMAELGRPQQH